MFYCVVLPAACPGVLHLEHQVIFNGAGVLGAHVDSRLLQQGRQTPQLVQDGGQEFMSVLNTKNHTDEFIHRGESIRRKCK